MNIHGSSIYSWDQTELENDTILNPNHNGTSSFRQIASRPESVSSFRYDEDALRSSITDLSLERRHPVQHPAGTNSDESLESSSLELGQEDTSLPSVPPQHSGHPRFHPGPSQHNGMRNGYPEQPMIPARQPMISPQYHLMQMEQQYQQHMGQGMHQRMPHPSRQNLPFHVPGHHHNGEMRHLLPQPTPLRQQEGLQRSQPSQHSAFVQTHPVPGNQPHLDNGFQAGTSDIGLQQSLSGIACPEAVLRQPPNREISSPEGSHAGSITELSDAENKESIRSECSYFVTMHPTYDDRMAPPKHQNDDKNRERVPQNHVPTTSNQASRNQTSGRTASTQPFNSPTPTQSGRIPQAPSQPLPSAKEVKVFITYATESSNSNHTRTVVQISQTLLRNSIDVAVDVLEETIRSMSSSEWLDNNINRSDFLLICVSPGYRDMVEGQSTSSQTGYHEAEKAVNTQYIYRRIHAEYIRNGSKNYRFIPVLVSGAKTEHIPPWLRDTRVFEWPKDYEDIIFRLFRKERFIKPKPGPPPKHTIELYSSYSERKTSRDSDEDNGSHTEPKKVA